MINAGIPVPLEPVRILPRSEHAHRHVVGIAAGFGRHLPEAGQDFQSIEASPADRHPAVAKGDRALCSVRKLAPHKDRRMGLLHRLGPRPQRLELTCSPWYSATSFPQIAFIASIALA